MTISTASGSATTATSDAPSTTGVKSAAATPAIVAASNNAGVSSSTSGSRATLNPWAPGADYPTNATGSSCVTSGGYVYCVGGGTDSVYYAAVSSSGVGAWTATTSYPTDITGQSCVASVAYIYCVSGIDGTQGPRPTSAVYYAPLSNSGGIGEWTRTTDYPAGAIALSCAESGGYVYCVGGADTVGALESNATYFAAISSTGVGKWEATTSYPSTIDDASCVASGGFIFCIAGYTALGPRAINTTYFAPVSSSGIGAWTAGTTFPTSDYGASCVTVGGFVYCIGGIAGSGDATDAVYYAPLSPSGGIGAWSTGESYPTGIVTSCVATGNVIACVSGSTSAGVEGRTGAVYYTAVGSQ
jgi:hypothetical protein